MSRSRRYHPIFGGGPSAKCDKRIWNRIERARTRDHLAHERWDEVRHRAVCPGEVAWSGLKENRGYLSPYENLCYCHSYRRAQCYYCQTFGSWERYLQKMMRK